MRRNILLDTGPLIALINQQDTWHHWSAKEASSTGLPLLTCESVISEACFLLQKVHGGKEAVMGLLEDQLIKIAFDLGEEYPTVSKLLIRYQSVPMSLADACLH